MIRKTDAQTDHPVAGCICYSHSFARLKELAGQNGWRSVDQIMFYTRCGSSCGLCLPYLHLMLLTGEESFPVLTQEQLASILKKREDTASAVHVDIGRLIGDPDLADL